MSFWTADFVGDIYVNEGQLGQTEFKTATGNITMTPTTDFAKIYHRYVIENNTGGSIDMTLPNINTALFTSGEVYVGWTCFIKNSGADNIIIKTPITGVTLITLSNDVTCMISARENNGQSVTDWEVSQFSSFGGPTGPTGEAGPAGPLGPTGPIGADTSDSDWFVQGGTDVPSDINQDIYTEGSVSFGIDGLLGTEKARARLDMIVDNLAAMPISGSQTNTLVVGRAFRYGDAGTDEFNDANVGELSVTFGKDITCEGDNSFAQGINHTISSNAEYCATFGDNNTLQNATLSYGFGNSNIIGTVANPTTSYTTGMGFNNQIYQDYNMVIGNSNNFVPTAATTSTLTHNFIFGNSNTWTAGSASTITHSTIMGDSHNLTAGMINSHLFGDTHGCSGDYSFISGREHDTGGDYSGTVGRQITNDANSCFATGAYGVTRNESNPSYQLFGGTSSSSSTGDGVGIVGRITATGAVQPTSEIITDTFTTGNADIGEYFEKTSALANTDLTGYFIKLDSIGNKIEIATDSTNVIGIGSGTCLMVGDAAELHWQGTNLTNDLGKISTTYCKSQDFKNIFKIFYFSDKEIMKSFRRENNLFTENNISYLNNFINSLPDDDRRDGLINMLDDDTRDRPVCNVINPSYNSNLSYMPRSKRTEWQIVGLLGKIYIYDDGTCVPGGKCTCNLQGIATNGNDWIVLERYQSVDESGKGVIRILYK